MFEFSNIARDRAVTTTVAPGTYTASSTKGTAIYVGQGKKVDVIMGLGAWTDGVQVWKIQESLTSTDGDFGDAPVASLDVKNGSPLSLDASGFLQVADATKNNKVIVVAYTGGKPYVRVTTGDTGGTTGGAGAAYVVVGQLRETGLTPGAVTDFDYRANPTS